MKIRMLTASLAVAAIALAVVASNPLAGRASGELEIGSTAPKSDVKMRDVSGASHSLAEMKGKKGLLVVFSCNTCPYVIKWEDRYRSIASKCADMGVGMVAVNSNTAQHDGVDSFEAMQKHAKEKRYSFKYVMDATGEVAAAFGANRTPHIYLFDGDMKLVYRGAIDDNYENAELVEKTYLADAIDALVAGQEIAVKTTKSIGCTIKVKK